MPKLIEKATGKEWSVPDGEVQGALASGLYKDPDPDMPVQVDDGSGHAGTVPFKDLQRHLSLSSDHAQAPAERAATDEQQRNEETYGGLGGKVGAALGSGLDTLGLGIPGGLAKGFAPDIYEDYQKAAGVNPGWATVGGVAGAVGLGALTGGAGAAAEGAEGAGLAARAGSAAIQGAKEGALLNTGAGVQQLVAGDDYSVEHMASVLGSHALLGAVAGGALGAGGSLVAEGGKTLAKGLSKAQRALAEAGDAATTAIPEDLATAEGVAAGKKAAPELIANYHQAVNEASPWLAMDKSAVLTKTSNSIRNLLDEPVGLAENPGKALDAIRRQGEALKRGVAGGEEAAAKLAASDVEMAGGIRRLATDVPEGAETVALEGKAAQRYSQSVLGKSRALRAEALEVPVADAAKFADALEAGEMQGARAKALEQMPALLEQNQVVESRLMQIRDAEKALGAPAKKGFLADMAEKAAGNYALGAVTHMLPGGFAGALAAKVAPKVIKFVLERAAKAVTEQGLGTEAAIDTFMGGGAKVVGTAGRATLPLSTKVLNSVSYGRAAEPAMAKGTTELAAAYKKRAAELSSQVGMGPDGAPQMTMQARRKVAGRLAPIASVAPVLADKLETHVAKKVEFLASKLPKRPGNGMQMGPDRWQPSNLEMRRFARFAAAAEDPAGIEQRLAHGVVSPEDAETYQTLYPERLAHLQMQIAQRLPELTKSLPYARKLSLSLLTGTALVPALQPEILRVLQGQYANEPGTEGGTEAPKAQPQFGSIKKESGTPSQQRSNPGQ